MSAQGPDLDKHWETVYKAVRESYDFLVENVNFQQQRVASVLIANGLIFGFLGASGSIFILPQLPPSPKSSSWLYIASMGCLALGLIVALVALFPLITPKNTKKTMVSAIWDWLLIRWGTQKKTNPAEEDLFLSPRCILNKGKI